MSVESVIRSLKLFCDYIEANNRDPKESSDLVKKYLKDDYNKERAQEDFHDVLIHNPDIKTELKKLFDLLRIDEEHWNSIYNASKTVYDFLNYLSDYSRHDTRIEHIISCIDKTTSHSKLKLFLAGLAVVAIVLAIYLEPSLYALLTAENITILGAAYTGISGLLKLKTTYDSRQAPQDKRRDILFTVSNAALNLVAYGLLIAAQGVMSPLIATLFVAASISDVGREVVLAYDNQARLRLRPLHNKKDNAERLQAEFEIQRHRNAAVINIGSALVLAGLIAVWSFLPASAVLTIGVVAAILIVHTVKNRLNRINDSKNQAALMRGLVILKDGGALNDGPGSGLEMTETPKPEIVKAVAPPHPSITEPQSGARGPLDFWGRLREFSYFRGNGASNNQAPRP